MKIILLFLFILATAYGLSGSDKYVSWNRIFFLKYTYKDFNCYFSPHLALFGYKKRW